MAIDHNSTPPHLYIADTANNRVLCFKNAFGNPTQADLVLGQTDLYSALVNSPLNDPSTMTQSGLQLPTDVVVDANGNVWVADTGNGRVLRFPSPFNQPAGTQILPTVVLGQQGFTGTPITNASIENMRLPFGLTIFSTGALAVSDAEPASYPYFQDRFGQRFPELSIRIHRAGPDRFSKQQSVQHGRRIGHAAPYFSGYLGPAVRGRRRQ